MGAGNNILEVQWNGNRNVKRFRVIQDGKILKDIDYGNDGKQSGSDRVNLNTISATSDIRIDVIDVYGYRYSHSTIESGGTADNNPILPSIQDE